MYWLQQFCIMNVHQTSQPGIFDPGFVTFLRSVITDLRLFVFPVDLHYDRSLPFMMSLREPQAMAACFFWGLGLVTLVLCHRKTQPFVMFFHMLVFYRAVFRYHN